MARLFKLELYLTDIEGGLNEEGAKDWIERNLNRIDNPVYIANCVSSPDFKWHDYIDINYDKATKEDYEKYFKGSVE